MLQPLLGIRGDECVHNASILPRRMRKCCPELPCGDFHPAMSIFYPHHPVSYFSRANDEKGEIGSMNGEIGCMTLRAFISGAQCPWRYYVVVAKVGTERVLWAQHFSIARHGDVFRVSATFPAPHLSTEASPNTLHTQTNTFPAPHHVSSTDALNTQRDSHTHRHTRVAPNDCAQNKETKNYFWGSQNLNVTVQVYHDRAALSGMGVEVGEQEALLASSVKSWEACAYWRNASVLVFSSHC